MTRPFHCPKCGTSLPEDAPGKICPQCLMQAGMESTVGYEQSDPPVLEPTSRFGPYQIVRHLGKGGMGSVYEAEHVESGRRIALKILNHKLQSPEHRRRFLREGRLAASLNHPNTVYIYGSEEIDGVPTIAMELAIGGTLQDKLMNDGPLPIDEAVDAILEVIDGLEAAQNTGVLHRDVKPSNCFIDADGTVKVGDFGLSISTAFRDDTNLTQSGVFLGTPAFASPEQLRGDELDIRSDIYSVGVTLYYLLTGKPPFEANQMVQLLATVLESPAHSPKQFRKDIPNGLTRVVLRCLRKKSSQRPATYEELRQDLLPYQSSAPTPGTIGFRVLANMIDSFALVCVVAMVPLITASDLQTWYAHFEATLFPGPQKSLELNLLSCVGLMAHFLYFGLFEGLFGSAAGKAICGLRVVGADREPPGVLRASLRAMIWLVTGIAPWTIAYLINREWAVRVFQGEGDSFAEIIVGIPMSFAMLFLFVSMRRHNGFAGLHGLASGTRVIRVPATHKRPVLHSTDTTIPKTPSESRIGPYDVLGPLTEQLDLDLILAYDTRLLRKVWIRRTSDDASPLDLPTRELARIGRLRWLHGQRIPGDSWDAYEALSGQPLLELLETPPTWESVRFWLLDIASELSAADSEGPLPDKLLLSRVWITGEGRAKILDFCAPRVHSDDTDSSQINAPLFLKKIAVAALEGRTISNDLVEQHVLNARIPSSARELICQLDSESTLSDVVQALESFTRKPAKVSLERRIGILVTCCVVPVMLCVLVLIQRQTEKSFLEQNPAVGQLAGHLAIHKTLVDSPSTPENDRLRNALEVVMSTRFRSVLADADLWSDPMVDFFLTEDARTSFQDLVHEQPLATAQEFAASQKIIKPLSLRIEIMSWSPLDYHYSAHLSELLWQPLVWALLAFSIVPALLSVLVLGNSLLLRFLEIAVVNSTGTPASRIRQLVRITAFWGIILLLLWLLAFMSSTGRPRLTTVVIIYGIIKMFTSERGVHDLVAGTWLVPR